MVVTNRAKKLAIGLLCSILFASGKGKIVKLIPNIDQQNIPNESITVWQYGLPSYENLPIAKPFQSSKKEAHKIIGSSRKRKGKIAAQIGNSKACTKTT